jgi:hypothetical protein
MGFNHHSYPIDKRLIRHTLVMLILGSVRMKTAVFPQFRVGDMGLVTIRTFERLAHILLENRTHSREMLALEEVTYKV